MSLPHPHVPVEAPLHFTDMYLDVEDDAEKREYYGMVSHMDHVIGSTVEALRETGLYSNTIIGIHVGTMFVFSKTTAHTSRASLFQ